MISAINLKKVISGRTLFEKVTFHVNDGDVVALAGDNGTGKTTLLRILAGHESSDEGQINCPKNTTIGYLPQEWRSESELPLYEEVSAVFSDIREMQAEMHELEEKFAMPEYDEKAYQKLLDRYGELQDIMQARDAFEVEGQIADVLRGLGFRRRDWQKPVRTFSGGWQMKICLAKILLQRPTVLLLDEPTNHLDIDARNWLEDFLKGYPFAVLMISHDRHFLDAMTKRIHEIFNKKLETYNCSFTAYLDEREERLEKVVIAKRKQEQEIARMQEFIDKHRAQIARAQLVQSRIRTIEKMEIIQVPPQRRKMRFSFPKAPHSGSTVVEVRDLAKSFGDNHVFKDINFTVARGEKVVLLGVNGAGKTTLLRSINSKLETDVGTVRLGTGVIVDHFDQDQTYHLNNNSSILEELMRDAPHDMVPRLRSLLGLFLFSGDDVTKMIGVLSGGERARVALAKMLLRPSNLLIMDEPTNHLDVIAKEVLMHALREYDGTILFVSHDRHFVEGIATRVIELYDGKLRDFPGTYSEFYEHKKRMKLDEEPEDLR